MVKWFEDWHHASCCHRARLLAAAVKQRCSLPDDCSRFTCAEFRQARRRRAVPGDDGRFIGLLREGGTNWFSYRYYYADTNGRSRLALGQLEWIEEGWPVAKQR